MNMVMNRSSRFVIYWLLILFCALCGSSKRIRNITTDQQALLALKAHITHDPFNVLSNWSTSAPVCTWVGVWCRTRHNRVTALDLSDMQLGGTIPPHLGNLSFLKGVAFYNNNLRGSFPSELANLRRMISFVFASNNLSGSIPTWIGSFTELQVLTLRDNSFTGSIPASICQLPKLVGLELSVNKLSGPIPENIGNLASLKLLYLYRNQLSGSIPSGIFNISTLRTVDMSGNFLSGFIPTPIVNMTSLRVLDFAFNNLSGVIPASLFSYFPNLEQLNFGKNMLSGPIPSSVVLCTRLQELLLFRNHFDGYIPEEIGNLAMLRSLYLGINSNFNGADIPQSFSNLSRLESLSIPRCSLTGSVPSFLGNLTALQLLDLTENNLTGIIPPEISNLDNLVQLSFGYNSIRGSIPSGIFNNSNLRTLVLAANRLSGQLPSSTGLYLPKLQKLYLAGNKLSGQLPIYISNASQLVEISLTENDFSGPIPYGLGNLRYLQILEIGANNLTSKSLSLDLSSLTSCKDLRSLQFNDSPLEGDLPISIGNFSSLERLILSNCKIRGTIPHQIGSLRNLVFLDLEKNELTGSIPTTIADLRNLQALRLSSNRLKGSLPSVFCNLEQLAFLFLGGNYLSGPIPSCVGNMISLRTFSLESNEFNLSIPLSFWSLKDVLEVNLATNSLTGPLSPAIGNLKTLVSLDMSKNILSGEIPSSIGDLRNLEYISLSSNRLEGLIPESFGDIVSLEFMELSSNDLSGEIPKSFEKLSHLRYFNVSYNQLEGEIPLGGPFTNFSFESFIGNEGLCGPVSLATKRCRNRKALELKYVLLVAIGSPILVLALLIVFIRYRMKNVRPPTEQCNDLSSLATMKLVSVHELTQATNGFDETNLLGIGSFGSVYKGILPDGANVAVKVFNLQRQEANKSFDVECEVLRSIRHRNLVKIITGCCNLDFKALVLEFMPNGNLDKWLYSHNYFLNMLQRLNVMIDVASALDHLHNGHHVPVVHCDLKPNNVLLDQEMVAHLGDFGIAKLLGEGNEVVRTITLATVGYMAPEYGSGGIVSTKCDVYSYGIMLIETFTRKRPTDEMFTSELSMIDWIEEAVYIDHAIQVVDANLLNTDEPDVKAEVECASSILALALKCCAKLPEERIDIKDALNSITKIKHKFLTGVSRAI